MRNHRNKKLGNQRLRVRRTLRRWPHSPHVMVLRQRLLAATLLVGVLAAGVRAADDEENPYKEDPDKTSECYAWAADGQCASNPSFMLSSCK